MQQCHSQRTMRVIQPLTWSRYLQCYLAAVPDAQLKKTIINTLDYGESCNKRNISADYLNFIYLLKLATVVSAYKVVGNMFVK